MTGSTAGSGVGLAAVDLGASSGRVIYGRVGPGVLELTEVHRFHNGPVALPDGLYWDILGLYQDILIGLRNATRREGGIQGIAIDAWAVDYGLIDARGSLIGNPRHYRDDRTAAVIDAVHAAAPAEKLYDVNGLQFLPFNTLYQFAADPRVHEPGTQALLIPDLLGYWLTGRRVAEYTNASTTGLLDARTGQWAADLIDTLGLPAGLLPPVVPPGSAVGRLTESVKAALGLTQDLTLSTVGSHDTASAIVGVPATTRNFGYISCGTWGLVGVELDAPVLTADSRAANFTNERGVDGTIRFLRNVMGLWLLSESMRTWELQGRSVVLTDVVAAAGELPAGGPLFDPDDPVFLPPGDIPARIAQVCAAGGRAFPSTPAEFVRCIMDSLAATFAARIEDAQRLSGQRIDVVHIVGGGSRNQVLCQLVADATGRPVVAGPVEATAIGNLLVQARTHGVLTGDLWTLRAGLVETIATQTYQPRSTRSSHPRGTG